MLPSPPPPQNWILIIICFPSRLSGLPHRPSNGGAYTGGGGVPGGGGGGGGD